MTWLQRIHGTVSPDVEIVAVSTTPDEPPPGHHGCHVLAVTRLAEAPLNTNPWEA